LREVIRIRQATKKDSSTIDKIIVEWLGWRTPREESIKRAVENKELLVADRNREVAGFIHCAMHEDIIDGDLNSFITWFYLAPEFRNEGTGSELLDRGITDASHEGAVGIETSTASPDASRLCETHHFKQFMGNWAMGEVFLELDMEKYKRRQKPKSV
jgi:GNAT superfamily N-acetyltransferase